MEEKAGWNETIRSSAIGGLSQMKTHPQAVDIILKYTRIGTPQPLRLAAIRALGTVSTGQTPDKVESILEQLGTIASETFFLTQVAAVVALGQMQTAKASGILGAISTQSPDGRVKRMAEEAMQKVQKNLGADRAVKELREEMGQIKQENQDLKSRLAKLEAKAEK